MYQDGKPLGLLVWLCHAGLLGILVHPFDGFGEDCHPGVLNNRKEYFDTSHHFRLYDHHGNHAIR